MDPFMLWLIFSKNPPIVKWIFWGMIAYIAIGLTIQWFSGCSGGFFVWLHLWSFIKAAL